MKLVRGLGVAFFVLALAAFIIYSIYASRTSDFTAPKISAESDSIRAGVNVTDEQLLAGMTAVDNLDGDVTDTLVVVSFSKFVKKNTRNVTYAAFDKNNNVGRYTRELTYTDYVAPHFVLKTPLWFHQNEEYDSNALCDLIGAQDVLDGDISSQIMITQGDRYTFDEDTERQRITVQVSNRAGDTAQLSLDVMYLSYAAFNVKTPALSDYVIYTTVGMPPAYRSYIQGVRSGTSTMVLDQTHFDIDRDFVFNTSNVDLRKPGTYSVPCTLYDGDPDERQKLGTVELIVVVEEP
ncbi:MAG: hypothetical protein IJL66_03120 [Lachnospiraceae bacterium]|nr:hypothetical protein [Lachnospiraceae bacterium]